MCACVRVCICVHLHANRPVSHRHSSYSSSPSVITSPPPPQTDTPPSQAPVDETTTTQVTVELTIPGSVRVLGPVLSVEVQLQPKPLDLSKAFTGQVLQRFIATLLDMLN